MRAPEGSGPDEHLHPEEKNVPEGKIFQRVQHVGRWLFVWKSGYHCHSRDRWAGPRVEFHVGIVALQKLKWSRLWGKKGQAV